MTLDQLLGKSASELEAMSDAQLIEYFTPFFSVTRPEQVAQTNLLKPKSRAVTFEELEKQKRLNRGQMLLEQFAKKNRL